jgi:hypothetical protein
MNLESPPTSLSTTALASPFGLASERNSVEISSGLTGSWSLTKP